MRYEAYTTELYRPPELWIPAGPILALCLKPECDMWSFACTVFEVATNSRLMAATKEGYTTHGTVRQWTKSWERQAASSHPGSPLASVHTVEQNLNRPAFQVFYRRWNRATPQVQRSILACLCPIPSLRKWPQDMQHTP
jgi:hypothetical protein